MPDSEAPPGIVPPSADGLGEVVCGDWRGEEDRRLDAGGYRVPSSGWGGVDAAGTEGDSPGAAVSAFTGCDPGVDWPGIRWRFAPKLAPVVVFDAPACESPVSSQTMLVQSPLDT
jgi:hypothetical protein